MQHTSVFAVRDAAGEAHAFSMTYDVTPAPGEVLRACGYGVTVVRRDPPSRPGAQWAAPYAANCAEHGWIASRATLEQASEEAHQHITLEHPTAADRVFTPGRQAQGFRSQAHLDAHFAYTDHIRGCGNCQRPGAAMWLEGSASWQATASTCPAGVRLSRIADGYLN